MLDYFLRKNIKSGLKEYRNRKHTFFNFNGIQSVLIFFDIQDWVSVMLIIADIEKNGKTVVAWTILPKSLKGVIPQKSIPKNVRIVDLYKEVDWKRVLRSEVFSEFGNLKYNTLLDLSFEDNDYMMSLRVRNKGVFNIGFRELEYKISDFIILKEEEKSLLETYEQMKFYLAHIQ